MDRGLYDNYRISRLSPVTRREDGGIGQEPLLPSANRILLRETRDALEKLRDFQRGNKVEDLLSVTHDHTLTVVAFLEASRNYIDATIDDAGDSRLALLRNRVINNLRLVTAEAQKRSKMLSGRKRFDRRPITSLITSFQDLYRFVDSNRPIMRDATERWATMMAFANSLWPGLVRPIPTQSKAS